MKHIEKEITNHITAKATCREKKVRLSRSHAGYRMLYCVFLEMDKDGSIHEDRKSNIVKQKILTLSTLLFCASSAWGATSRISKMVNAFCTYVMFNPKHKRSVSFNNGMSF